MAFQKLSIECLKRIRPLLKNKLPKSTMMLNIFDMTLSGKNPTGDIIQIHGYNGVPDEENLFINVMIKGKEWDIELSVIYSPEHVTDGMMSAFSNLFDWTKKHEYGAVPVHFATHLEKLVLDKGGSLSKGPANDMYLPIESARNLKIDRENLQQEIELDRLSPEHALKVNAHWKYGGEGHEHSIADAIRSFGGAGLFKKPKNVTDDKSSGRQLEDLVSWVVILRVGTLNALHTLDEYRCKGLGKWTMEAAAKWMAEEGLIPLCEIEPNNKQSRSLVEKIGFQHIQEVYWMEYTPPTSVPSSS